MADSNDVQQLIQVLTGRLDRQEKQQEVTNDLLLRMLTQQEAMFQLQQNFQRSQQGFNERQEQFNERQEKFNERQEKFNERQDQYSIIFLDEIHDIKHDVRELKKDIGILKDVTLKQHDERLKKLEDFMDGLLRKAS
ncbi:hypothetical protein [Hymenobacter sp.]|uniref:hypothetical protein n=1 Tax=Hymenobacter sp. TaxID=1898978 RepID=UPI00286A2F29|nr:hypothetical protein [Hymenobacter sp.]